MIIRNWARIRIQFGEQGRNGNRFEEVTGWEEASFLIESRVCRFLIKKIQDRAVRSSTYRELAGEAAQRLLKQFYNWFHFHLF